MNSKKTLSDVAAEQLNGPLVPGIKFNSTNSTNVIDLSSDKLSLITNIKFKKSEEDAIIPNYAHDGDLGMDVTCNNIEYDKVLDAWKYHTGLIIESPKNVGCFAMPRSKNVKTEVYMPNSIGLIDTYIYRGELIFVYKDRTSIDTIANQQAVKAYLCLPWWKRIFTKFEDLLITEYNFEQAYRQSNPPYKIGDKIGQLVFYSKVTVTPVEVTGVSETERGEGGFGSTGD